MLLQANYHTHTTLCDGKDSPEDNVKQALDYGFRHLGFSGHMDNDVHMDLPAYVREIHRLQDKYNDRIEILCGMELDLFYTREVQNIPCVNEIEYIIGSTHFLKVPDGNLIAVDTKEDVFMEAALKYYDNDFYKMAADYYEAESHVYEQTHCDFVGHFDLITRYNDELHFLDESSPAYYTPALDCMKHLVRQGVPFEINCGGVVRKGKKELYPNMFLLKKLHEFGGEILINSDSHKKAQLNGAFSQALIAAEASGFDHINILTKEETGRVHFQQLKI